MAGKFGNYSVIKEVGRGRISIVYHVRDTINRDYALKVLFPLGKNDEKAYVVTSRSWTPKS